MQVSAERGGRAFCRKTASHSDLWARDWVGRSPAGEQNSLSAYPSRSGVCVCVCVMGRSAVGNQAAEPAGGSPPGCECQLHSRRLPVGYSCLAFPGNAGLHTQACLLQQQTPNAQPLSSAVLVTKVSKNLNLQSQMYKIAKIILASLCIIHFYIIMCWFLLFSLNTLPSGHVFLTMHIYFMQINTQNGL